MGNAFRTGCTTISKPWVKLVFFDGTTEFLTGKVIAGELMFKFPDQIICHADSFYIGHPIPALSIDDKLVKGETYFVLPIDPFANQVLSTKLLLLTFSPTATPPKRESMGSLHQPFQYLKGTDGRALIKVSPDFLIGRISGEGIQGCNGNSNSPLCSTPELRKQYELLVGHKELLWSPKLETISEHKNGRMSPWRLFGLERRSRKIQV